MDENDEETILYPALEEHPKAKDIVLKRPTRSTWALSKQARSVSDADELSSFDDRMAARKASS